MKNNLLPCYYCCDINTALFFYSETNHYKTANSKITTEKTAYGNNKTTAVRCPRLRMRNN